jgi:plasmid stabilization system protein ParE
MPKDVHLLADAIAEAQEAVAWYSVRSQRAAARFEKELSRAIDKIRENPLIHPVYVHGTRFCRLRRFPFLAVFREKPDIVEVVAIAHAHRRPGYWTRRSQ